MIKFVINLRNLRSNIALVLLGTSLSACSGVTSGRTGSAAGDFSAAGVGEKGSVGAAADETRGQPSLPGGVVATEYDPHDTGKMTVAAEAGLLCKDIEKGMFQVRLTGQVKDAEGDVGKEPTILRVINNGIELIDLPVDGELRFDKTFLVHGPLSFKLQLVTLYADTPRPVFFGDSESPEMPSMVGCRDNVCDNRRGDVVNYPNGQADESLFACGVPKGVAQATVVCRDTDKGTLQVRVSGQLGEVEEAQYPKDKLFVRIFNAGVAPEFYDVRVDDHHKFQAIFEAHAPVRFEFGARVLTTGSSVYYTRPGQMPAMIACPTGNCLSTEGVVRMPMELEGSLIPEASLVACAAPTSPVITTPPPAEDAEPMTPSSTTLQRVFRKITATSEEGVVRVDLSGKLTWLPEDGERPTHVRIFNVDASSVRFELEDMRLAADLSFKASFLAHARANPLKLSIYAFKTGPENSLYNNLYDPNFTGEVPDLIVCAETNCPRQWNEIKSQARLMRILFTDSTIAPIDGLRDRSAPSLTPFVPAP